jgi:hypothetical protein
MQRRLVLVLSCCTICLFALTIASAQNAKPKLNAYSAVKGARDASGNSISPAAAAGTSGLPTFGYQVLSSRDGNLYTGVMVGQDPFSTGGFTPTNVTAPVVPLIITTHTVATGISSGGILSTKNGTTVSNPTAADTACLGARNNVPLTLFLNSPIFQSASFTFGGTNVGRTQYVDAYQRANFWNSVAGTNYHTLLTAGTRIAPISLDIAANQGLAIPPSLFGSCGSLTIVNISTLDGIITNTILPQLAAQGVDTSQFPIFLLYNAVMSGGVPTNLNKCCVLGFHGSTGSPIQTYSPIDFDTTGLFSAGIHDTSIAAHEVGEWMDDPFGNNPTPAWGHTGQVSGCQNNLENGDPLTGTNVPTVNLNGFTYHLQELAFFSWFYGAPSIAANGWFSDNNTFKTDAGPVCK